MKKRIYFIGYIPGFLALVGVVYLLSRQGDVNAVAFVRSEDLVYGYAGMKEVENAFAAKEIGRKANLDSLTASFQRDYASAMEGAGKMSVEEKKATMAKLQGKQGQLVGYSEAVQAESDKEEAEMLSSVLDQINAFARTYAEEHGYSMVYGTTSGGNILYGDPGLDITDELLAALNANYRGE